MATPEQKAASKKIADAVTSLNAALKEAAGLGMHVELGDVRDKVAWCRYPQYIIDVIEVRETVLPE